MRILSYFVKNLIYITLLGIQVQSFSPRDAQVRRNNIRISTLNRNSMKMLYNNENLFNAIGAIDSSNLFHINGAYDAKLVLSRLLLSNLEVTDIIHPVSSESPEIGVLLLAPIIIAGLAALFKDNSNPSDTTSDEKLKDIKIVMESKILEDQKKTADLVNKSQYNKEVEQKTAHQASQDPPQVVVEEEDAVDAKRTIESIEKKYGAEQEAKLKAEQEAKFKAEQEAKVKAEQEAKLKAEQEAKLKAEQEAKLKAEQEAKLKAEQEAKLKAEQEAKLKAEQETKLRAEQEAKLKAEQETKLRAEQEDKLQAEQNAILKAEQEAKLKAEQELREKTQREASEYAKRVLKFNKEMSKVMKAPKVKVPAEFLDPTATLTGNILNPENSDIQRKTNNLDDKFLDSVDKESKLIESIYTESISKDSKVIESNFNHNITKDSAEIETVFSDRVFRDGTDIEMRFSQNISKDGNMMEDSFSSVVVQDGSDIEEKFSQSVSNNEGKISKKSTTSTGNVSSTAAKKNKSNNNNIDGNNSNKGTGTGVSSSGSISGGSNKLVSRAKRLSKAPPSVMGASAEVSKEPPLDVTNKSETVEEVAKKVNSVKKLVPAVPLPKGPPTVEDLLLMPANNEIKTKAKAKRAPSSKENIVSDNSSPVDVPEAKTLKGKTKAKAKDSIATASTIPTTSTSTGLEEVVAVSPKKTTAKKVKSLESSTNASDGGKLVDENAVGITVGSNVKKSTAKKSKAGPVTNAVS